MRWKLAVFAIMLGVMGGAVFAVTSPTPVAADGSAGSGGSGGGGGSGCSAGHWLACGYGWVEYNISSVGPTDGLKNNAYWPDIRARCFGHGAQTISVFVVLEGDGSAQGYNYEKSMDGDPTRFPVWNGANRNKVDNNKATVIGNGEAQSGWDKYVDAVKPNKTNLNYGSDVSWFCSNFEKPDPVDWDLVGGTRVSEETAERGETVYFRHQVTNNGPDPATFGWKVTEQEVGVNDPDGEPEANGWTGNLKNGSATNLAKGKSAPEYDNWRLAVKIPANAAIGKKFCQRIEYGQGAGPGTRPLNDNPEHSDRKCVRVVATPPEPQACKFVEVWNQGTYTTPGGDKRATRAVVNIDGAIVKKVNGNNVTTEYTNVTNENVPDANGDLAWKNKTWNIQPNKSTIKITVQKQYWGEAANVWIDIAPATTRTVDCYSATCALSVTGPGLGGRVMAGEKATVNGWVYNDAPTADNLPLNNPFLWGTGNSFSNGLDTVPRFKLKNIDPITIDAPTSVQNWDIGYAIIQWGINEAIGSCTITVPVYGQVGIMPVAQTVLNNGGLSAANEESPTNFQHTASLNNVTGAPTGGAALPYTTCAYKITSSVTDIEGCTPGLPYVSTTLKNQSNQPKKFINGDASLVNPNNYALTGGEAITPVAGDRYCTYISTDSAGGIIGPGGDVIGGNFDESLSCATVKNKPYFKIYGSGAQAGGGFEDVASNCAVGGTLASWSDNNSANISSSLRSRGASSELSSIARLAITGVASAQTSGTRSPTELTFANKDVSITSSSSSPTLGGDMGGGGWCLPKVDEPDNISSGGAATIDTLGSSSGSRKYTPAVGSYLTLNTRSLSPGTNQSVFVDGDVYINGNITYNTTGWTKNNIPSFVLKATGNIYVGANVTNLDGLYIAQGKLDGGTVKKGKIFTCSAVFGVPFAWVDTNPNPTWKSYNFCKTQLVVRGAFVAEQVNLMRTGGSLRDSKGIEHPRPAVATPNAPCSNSLLMSEGYTCAAEVFDFSPEMYLSSPAIKKKAGNAPQWQMLISLPPVL